MPCRFAACVASKDLLLRVNAAPRTRCYGQRVRRLCLLVSLAACGRVDFGAHPDGTPLPAVDTSLAEAYPMVILGEHPVAYYRVDEASAAVAAVDVSGHADHGSYFVITGGHR